MRFDRFHSAILCLSLVACVNSPLKAQQRQVIISPEVQKDRRVTFRLRAPNAKSVAVNLQGTHSMTKNDEGLWSVTIGPLKPEIYDYDFTVDGLHIVDPSNDWLFRKV